MHKYLVYVAYGWLALSGVLHFIADVVYQHLSGKRIFGPETISYFGLHSAYALGQVAFGALALITAWRAMHVFNEAPALVLSLVAGLGWLAVTFLFMSFWEPKANAGIYCALIVAALIARP